MGKAFEEHCEVISRTSRGNAKLIYIISKVKYKTNLAEEIQRDKSKDSAARSTTYILLENRVAERRMGLCTTMGT